MSGTQKVIKLVAIALAIFLIVNIFSGIVYALSWFNYLGPNDEDKKGNVEFEEIYSNISEVEVEGEVASIIISSGNEFKVKAEDLANRLVVENKNGKLEIEEKNKWLSKNRSGKIYITVPTGSQLNRLSIETGAGKFEIKDVNVEDFEIDHGAGVLEISNVNFNKADIDGGAGVINIDSSVLGKLDLDAGVGKVNIRAEITDDSKISCGVGDVGIVLLGGTKKYQIRSEKGIGKVLVNGFEQSNGSLYGDGSTYIELEGGIGNLEVDFGR